MTDTGTREWNLYTNILPVITGAVMNVIAKLPPEEAEREGGYFCLVEQANHFVPVAVALIGEVTNPEKRQKYFDYAREKATRLGNVPLPTHVSSWLTRNPEKNKWGGGIKAGNYYMAFSGLPELADEAAMLLAAWRLGWLTKDQADAIAKQSNNQIFLENEWMTTHRT